MRIQRQQRNPPGPDCSMDSAIHRINHCPVDNQLHYPVDRYLSDALSHIHLLNSDGTRPRLKNVFMLFPNYISHKQMDQGRYSYSAHC